MNDLTPFDYATLGSNEQVIRGIAKRIASTVRTLAASVFAIGRELRLARNLIGDDFPQWVAAEFGFSERTVRNYCRVSEQLGDYEDRMSSIPPSTLYILAGECVPPEAIETAIARTEAGEKVTASDAKEIIADSLDYEAPELPDDEADPESVGFDEPTNGICEPAASNAAPRPNTSPLWAEAARCIDRAWEIYKTHAQDCDESAEVIAALERAEECHGYYVRNVEAN
jgi:hypothetical protein